MHTANTRFTRLITAGLSLLGLLAGLCQAEQPQPFKAHYAAQLNGFKISASRELIEHSDGSQTLDFKADSLLAQLRESSRFDWQEQQLVPRAYEYHRTGLGRDRHASLSFDWTSQRVTNDVQNKPWRMDIPLQTLDKLSYQLQLRSDLLNQRPLSYKVADGGRLKHYHFNVLGEEIIETPLGSLRTLKVQRLRDHDKKRQTYLWLACDWNFLLVRLQQRESNGKYYEINLSQAQVAGEQVTSLNP